MPKLRCWFRHSIFGRLTEVDDRQSGAILKESRTVRFMMRFYEGIRFYMGASIFLNGLKRVKVEFSRRPLKSGSVMLVTAMLTSLLLSVLFKRIANGWILMLEITLAYGGCLGLLCDSVGWPVVREDSRVFKMARGMARWF